MLTYRITTKAFPCRISQQVEEKRQYILSRMYGGCAITGCRARPYVPQSGQGSLASLQKYRGIVDSREINSQITAFGYLIFRTTKEAS